jgi:hypothetical protein
MSRNIIFIFSGKLIVAHLVKKFRDIFIKTEGSLPCSQEYATELQLVEFNPHPGSLISTLTFIPPSIARFRAIIRRTTEARTQSSKGVCDEKI